MDLLQKHQVTLLHQGPDPYLLDFRLPLHVPELDRMVADWRNAQGEPFPERDIIPHRVGVAAFRSPRAIQCFPASWAQYMLMSKSGVRKQLPIYERFHVLSLACLVRTSDGQLALSYRSRNVSHYPDMWHVSAAGYADLAIAEASRTAFFQFARELEEELNVLSSHIATCRQLGLCQHTVPDSASIEICLFAQVNLTGEQLVERARDAKDSWEGKVYVFPEEKVRQMLEEETFNPAAAATLMIYFNIV